MSEAVIRLRLDAGNVVQGSGQVAQAIGKIGQVGEVSARQTAAAFRTLPAQFTDIATQLAGGQNPLLILLQQGGQIKDSFGGIGPAIRGISAAISPAALGVGALAAVVGGLGFAAYKGGRDTAELRDTIALTGNAAGLTAGRVDALALSVVASSGQTVVAAREIVMALAATGTVAAPALASTARAVARLADLTGQEGKEIAKDFAGMSAGVAKWAAEHNKAWNFITAERYKYIKGLEDQGKVEEAILTVNGLLLSSLDMQRQQLGNLEAGWEGLAKKVSAAKQAMLNWGRPDGIDQAIEKVAADLDRLRKASRNEAILKPDQYLADLFGTKPLVAQIAEAEALLNKLRESKRLSETTALTISAAAAVERKSIADLLKETPAARERSGKPYIPGQFEVFDARDGMVLAARREKAESEREAFFQNELRKQDERDAKRLEVETEFLDGLRDSARRAAVELIQDERHRGEALVALDLEIANRRLGAKGLSAAGLEEARRLNQAKADSELQSMGQRLGASTYDDVKGALAAAFRDSNNPAKAFASALGNAIFTRVTSRLADALATAAVGRDGQGGAWGDLLSYVGSVVGGGISVDTTGVSTNNTGGSLPTRGGMATGTNYVPRDMLALVHRGEAIVPARYNHAGAGSIHVTQHISVPPGMSPAAFGAMLKAHGESIKGSIFESIARPGRPGNMAVQSGVT